MKLEGEGRNFLKKGFSLPLQTSPLPLQRLSYAGVGSGFVLSNGPIGAPSFGWMIQSRYISSQNGQAFSVTCSLLHARNASNGRHAEKPLSAPQARKSCEQGFDNVKNLWGRRGRGLSPERFLLPSPVFPPHLPLPAHSEILGLAQTELGTDEALLIGERGRGGSRQHGTAARALE